MGESTLSLSLRELAAEVGHFLGYSRGADFGDGAWTRPQRQAIDSCVASGLHKFYFPPVLPGERAAHEWSFLKPTTLLALDTGRRAVVLPGDFGGLSGGVAVTAPEGYAAHVVEVGGIGRVDRGYAEAADQTGPPRYAAKRPLRGTGVATGQRWELAVYPAADRDYTLAVTYTLAPDALSPANPYPYGGPVHRETLLESCLAVAESRLDDAAQVHQMLFVQQLQASVSHDRKFRPEYLGYNGDAAGHQGRDRRYDYRLVTVGGLHS